MGRISALSRSLKQYRFLDPATGQLIEKPLSPERGQMVLTLVASSIKFGRGIDCSRADLNEAKSLSGTVITGSKGLSPEAIKETVSRGAIDEPTE